MKYACFILLFLSITSTGRSANDDVPTDADVMIIKGLGAPAKLERAPDDGVFYKCRFLLKEKNKLITMTAYTSKPRDRLTRGTSEGSGDEKIFYYGFRPNVVKLDLEIRELKDASISVKHGELNNSMAAEFDALLFYSNLFELCAIDPWLVKKEITGEYIYAQLMIENREVEIRRTTGQSLPLKTVMNYIEAVIAQKQLWNAGNQ